MKRLESWARPHMRKLLLGFAGGGLAGMAVIALLALLFKWMGWGGIPLGLFFVPWMVGGFLVIPAAFQRGVKLERDRQQ